MLTRLSPRAATTAAYVIGTAFLLPLAALAAPAFPPALLGSGIAWAVVVLQGTLGTLSHVWYYRGVQTVGPSVTAVFMTAPAAAAAPCTRWPVTSPGAGWPPQRVLAALGRAAEPPPPGRAVPAA